MKKVYAVMLHESAADEIATFTVPWLRREHGVSYFYASAINPNDFYFHMTLNPNAPLAPDEFELQLPHSYIKAVLYSADYKAMGFTAAPGE